MPWNILANPIAIISIIVSIILLTVPIIPVEITTTTYTFEPYTYQQSLIRTTQVRNFPWIKEVTQFQYIIKNTDVRNGSFDLNFVFDNNEDIDTITKSVDILAGEEKAVTVDSPLRGESTVTLNVIPPKKSIPQESTIIKNVTAWSWLVTYAFR